MFAGAHRMRQFWQPRFDPLNRGGFERSQMLRQRTFVHSLDTKLQQPREPMGAEFLRDFSYSTNRDVGGRDALRERRLRRRERRFRVRPQIEPAANVVHRRVPA